MTSPVPAQVAADHEIEAVAVALWKFDVKDGASVETLARLWPRVCKTFPEDAASYRGAAQVAINALAVARSAAVVAEGAR